VGCGDHAVSTRLIALHSSWRHENRLGVLESAQSLGSQFPSHAGVLDSAVRRGDVGQIVVDPNGARVDVGGHRYGMVVVG